MPEKNLHREKFKFPGMVGTWQWYKQHDARRICSSVEIQLVWKSIHPTMLNKYARFRDSETVPEPTECSQKLSARTSEVASPVQFLSDSDETTDTLSPALVPPKPARIQHVMEVSDDDESFQIKNESG